MIGALALAIADEVQRSVQQHTPEEGPAAAALALLANEPGVTIVRLRSAVGLSHPGAVRLVDRLVDEGVFERRPALHDRRAVALHLTPAGMRMADAVTKAKASVLERALARCTPAEAQVMTGLAAKMLGGLVRDADHGYAVCRFCVFDACEDCPVDAELCERRLS